jgi:hypothetical protein
MEQPVVACRLQRSGAQIPATHRRQRPQAGSLCYELGNRLPYRAGSGRAAGDSSFRGGTGS